MPKEEIAMLSPLRVSLGLIIPIALGRVTAGPRPMSVFLWGYPLRIGVTLLYAWVIPMSRWGWSSGYAIENQMFHDKIKKPFW